MRLLQTVASAVGVDQFNDRYGAVYDGPEQWRELEATTGEQFQWDTGSTYIQPPPYFDGF